MDFTARVKDLIPEMTESRRYLHKNAEVGQALPITTAFVMKKLKEMGLNPREICESGVTAVIEGGRPGRTIMLRADMDALPMKETSGLPFQSDSDYAHTCGHDLHTAMLLCAARMLVEQKDTLAGNVKLMFQPAEEIFTGSQAMLDAGLMECPHVDASIDMHVMSELPVSSITEAYGYVTSSCDGFKITINGKACHGAQPHNGIDPIAVAAHLHTGLQQLIARETPPDKIAVLTIGQLIAGTTANIIPETAVMQGTFRCYDKELRRHLVSRLKEMTEHVASAYGASAVVEFFSDVPSIFVDKDMLKECMGYIDEMGMELEHITDYLFTASDDYARVSELVPSIFVSIGARPADDSLFYPNHNSNVIFNEDCMPIGASIFAQCAYKWLEAHQIQAHQL